MAKKRDKDKRGARQQMARHDVEREVAIAGAKALASSRGQSTDPAVLRAMAKGARRDVIGELEVRPASLANMLAIDALWGTALWPTLSPIKMLIYLVYAYLRPDETLEALNAGGADAEEQFRRDAESFSRQVPLEQVKKISVIVRSHIKDLMGDGSGGAADAVAPGGE